MGKRVTHEYFCDICKMVMPNERLKTETSTTVQIGDLSLDVCTAITLTPDYSTISTKYLAVCRECVETVIHKIAKTSLNGIYFTRPNNNP